MAEREAPRSGGGSASGGYADGALPHPQQQQQQHNKRRLVWSDLDLVRYMGLGCLTGMSVDSALYPIEVVKTRLQVQGATTHISMPGHAVAPTYASFWDCVRQMARTEGYLGFYRGFWAQVAAAVPMQLISFGSYEFSKHELECAILENRRTAAAQRAWAQRRRERARELEEEARTRGLDAGAADAGNPRHTRPEAGAGAGAGAGADEGQETDATVSAAGAGGRGRRRRSVEPSPAPDREAQQPHQRAADGARVENHGGTAEPRPRRVHVEVPDAEELSVSDELLVDFTAGAIGEVLSSVVWIPADIVTQKLQLQGPDAAAHRYRGGLDCLLSIIRHEGVGGLYRGVGPTMATYVPSTAVQFAAYQQLKALCYRTPYFREGHDESHAVNMAAGAGAGAIAAAAATPLDVVKTRVQTQDRGDMRFFFRRVGMVQRHDYPLVAPRYRSTWQSMKLIVREEGLRALSKGMSARIIAMAPYSALTFAVYEVIKLFSVTTD